MNILRGDVTRVIKLVWGNSRGGGGGRKNVGRREVAEWVCAVPQGKVEVGPQKGDWGIAIPFVRAHLLLQFLAFLNPKYINLDAALKNIQ